MGEGFIIFLSFFAIIFVVLQIILFFKMWGMTNYVNAMRKIFAQEPGTSNFRIEQAMKEYYKGNQQLGNILFDALFDELEFIASLDKQVYDREGRYKKTIYWYKAVYEKVGVPFPDVFEKIKEPEDFYNAFTKVVHEREK